MICIETIVVSEFNGDVTVLAEGEGLAVNGVTEVIGGFAGVETNGLTVGCAESVKTVGGHNYTLNLKNTLNF